MFSDLPHSEDYERPMSVIPEGMAIEIDGAEIVGGEIIRYRSARVVRTGDAGLTRGYWISRPPQGSTVSLVPEPIQPFPPSDYDRSG